MPIFDFTQKKNKEPFKKIKKFNKIFENCSNSQKNYTDIKFKPNNNSIAINSFDNGIMWLRATHFLQNEKIKIMKNIGPEVIQQGSLGNCYFMSGLIVLSKENHKYIERLFKNNIENNNGLYNVWICLNGAWKLVILDDFFSMYK